MGTPKKKHLMPPQHQAEIPGSWISASSMARTKRPTSAVLNLMTQSGGVFVQHI